MHRDHLKSSLTQESLEAMDHAQLDITVRKEQAHQRLVIKVTTTHKREQHLLTTVFHAHQDIFVSVLETLLQLLSVRLELTVAMVSMSRLATRRVNTVHWPRTTHNGVHSVCTSQPLERVIATCAQLVTSV